MAYSPKQIILTRHGRTDPASEPCCHWAATTIAHYCSLREFFGTMSAFTNAQHHPVAAPLATTPLMQAGSASADVSQTFPSYASSPPWLPSAAAAAAAFRPPSRRLFQLLLWLLQCSLHSFSSSRNCWCCMLLLVGVPQLVGEGCQLCQGVLLAIANLFEGKGALIVRAREQSYALIHSTRSVAGDAAHSPTTCQLGPHVRPEDESVNA